jgi:hypothetical protein
MDEMLVGRLDLAGVEIGATHGRASCFGVREMGEDREGKIFLGFWKEQSVRGRS